MAPKLLMHPITSSQTANIISSMPHALLISGSRGSGKKYLAEYIASKVMDKEDINGHPYILRLFPVKQTIGIEAMRELRSFLGRKTTGSGAIRRIVIICEADFMTIEAQNALLKSLEEPPSDTMIILTSSEINNLLPTILSRAQQLRVEPLSKMYTDKALGSIFDREQLDGAFYMSGGRASLLLALLEHKKEHPLAHAINEAKRLLSLSVYERLAIIDYLCKDKQQLVLLLDGLQRVVVSALHQAASKNDTVKLTRLHNISKQIQISLEALTKNANTKLVMSNLILQM